MSDLLRFSIAAWSAWAPGLTDAAAWRAWALAPTLPAGPERPELPSFPPLLRRRAERLARMALFTAQELRAAESVPMIFASARGEIGRGLQLLQELAREGRVSPGPFSLSVHNAVAALDSIAHGDKGNYSAIAAGAESAEAALVEACGLLADGHSQVLVTVYDEVLPEIYREFADEPHGAFAWSWLIVAPDGLSTMTVNCSDPVGASLRANNAAFDQPRSRASALPQEPATHPQAVLPHALDVLRYYLSNDTTLSHDGPHHRWTWSRIA